MQINRYRNVGRGAGSWKQMKDLHQERKQRSCEEGSTCRKQNLKQFRTNYNIFPFNNYALFKNEKQLAQTCSGSEIPPTPEKHSVIHAKNTSLFKCGRSSCPIFIFFFKLNNLKHIVHVQRKIWSSSTTANLPPFARKNIYVFSAWGLWFTSQFTVDVANKSLDILTKHQVFQMQINSLWEFFFFFQTA